MQFITVASIPIWSAFVRSIVSLVLPLQKFPPPITIPTCVPLSTICLTCFATSMTVASSKPWCLSPASASPLNLVIFYSYLFTLEKSLNIDISVCLRTEASITAPLLICTERDLILPTDNCRSIYYNRSLNIYIALYSSCDNC